MGVGKTRGSEWNVDMCGLVRWIAKIPASGHSVELGELVMGMSHSLSYSREENVCLDWVIGGVALACCMNQSGYGPLYSGAPRFECLYIQRSCLCQPVAPPARGGATVCPHLPSTIIVATARNASKFWENAIRYVVMKMYPSTATEAVMTRYVDSEASSDKFTYARPVQHSLSEKSTEMARFVFQR